MRNALVLITFILASSMSVPTVEAGQPTFSSDVAKIIFDKCTICHRPGSSGPFSLTTYDDVEQRAQTIKAVIKNRYMPPWKPVDHGIKFANSRSLTAQESRTVLAWIEADCPEGDRGKTPSPPKFTDGWMLGKPDMIVKMNGKFQIPADGPDIYRSFVFRLDLPEDRWVKAVELRPKASSSVHHALFFLDTTGNARKLDGADGKAGMSGMGFLANLGGSPGKGEDTTRDSSPFNGIALLQRFRSGQDSAKEDNQALRVNDALARGLGGYVPGSVPNRLPGDLSMLLPRGSDVVMQTHFHPSGKAEVEQAELALYFAKRPSSQEIVPIMVPPMFGFGKKIRIPAGKKDYRITDQIRLPVDTRAIGVSGHAHYVCRAMKLTARLPSGKSKILLHIDDWDLDWQDQYLFSTPVDLPAGTVLRSEIVYDNSADNPENPNHPPKEITWGRDSDDEMGSLTLLTVAKRHKDSVRLQTAVRGHLMSMLVDRGNSEMVQMLMQLDDNDDGKLQRSEAPPRLNTQAFAYMDTNRDGGLDASEFLRFLKLVEFFRNAKER